MGVENKPPNGEGLKNGGTHDQIPRADPPAPGSAGRLVRKGRFLSDIGGWRRKTSKRSSLEWEETMRERVHLELDREIRQRRNRRGAIDQLAQRFSRFEKTPPTVRACFLIGVQFSSREISDNLRLAW